MERRWRSRTRRPRRRSWSWGSPPPAAARRGGGRGERGFPGLGGDARGRARGAPARGGHAHAGAHGRAARVMTLEGGKPLDRELGRGRLDGLGLRLLRRDGPQLRRPRDSVDRVHPARAGREGADRRMGLHRAVELPAAAAGVEAGARDRRGQHRGGEAVRAHAAVHADARLLLRPPAAGRGEHRGGCGRRGLGDRRTTNASRAWRSRDRSRRESAWPRPAPRGSPG